MGSDGLRSPQPNLAINGNLASEVSHSVTKCNTGRVADGFGPGLGGDGAAVSVLLATWRRPEMLVGCLAALGRQTRRPGQVVVAVRRDDAATLAVLGPAGDGLRAAGVRVDVVEVEPGPLTASMNAGLGRTVGELVALTDDDSEPWPDWLERLAGALADPAVGGAGGRDWLPVERGDAAVVGRVSWYGRVVGNHHLGRGPARDVELLKGVNCCFRGDELRRIGFDRRLRGRGNVSHWELGLCFAFRRAGWRLVYDPAICVDHHLAVRHDGDTNVRGTIEPLSLADGIHNETLSLLEHLTAPERAAFVVWAAVVGTWEYPGLVQVLRLAMRRRADTVQRWRATVIGRWAGLCSFSSVRARRSDHAGGTLEVLGSHRSGGNSESAERPAAGDY